MFYRSIKMRIKRNFAIITALMFVMSLVACTKRVDYQKLSLNQTELESIETENLSSPESWGRWTDGSPVIFKFPANLPEDFKLSLNVGDAFGLNLGKDIVVDIGGQIQTFKGPARSSDPSQPNIISLEFKGTNTNIIKIICPSQISPKEMGVSNDPRKLGISLISLEISPITK